MNCFDRDHAVLLVLTNQEGDCALWPHWKRPPAGWRPTPDVRGDKTTVLASVELAWTAPSSLLSRPATHLPEPQPRRPEAAVPPLWARHDHPQADLTQPC